MSPTTPITEDDLHAYVDGALQKLKLFRVFVSPEVHSNTRRRLQLGTGITFFERLLKPLESGDRHIVRFKTQRLDFELVDQLREPVRLTTDPVHSPSRRLLCCHLGVTEVGAYHRLVQ